MEVKVDKNIFNRMLSFKDWFRDYKDYFVIIGGTACSLIMSNEEADFRATKDIDIVLLAELLDLDFGKHFWGYILEAGYKHCQKSTGKPQFYRFYEPKSKIYPEMIELFSRRIDGLSLPDDAVITPVPISEDISSLSAILLNDEYYEFLRDGVQYIDDLPVLDKLFMLPFKAKAWLDLVERKNKGNIIDSKDIRKHKLDIYRISDVIVGGFKFTLPKSIEKDMQDFLVAAQEALLIIPLKQQKAERMRIDKVAEFYGLL
jgi:hypothetical protein